MDRIAVNGKLVLEPYVGRSPIPAPPELDYVDIDGQIIILNYRRTHSVRFQRRDQQNLKSVVSHVTASDKAKWRKMCGCCPCCRREDVTLSCNYNRPMMILAVGLVTSFRTIFDSLRWKHFESAKLAMYYPPKPWRKLVPNSVTCGN
jgi:hypothetical protein